MPKETDTKPTVPAVPAQTQTVRFGARGAVVHGGQTPAAPAQTRRSDGQNWIQTAPMRMDAQGVYIHSGDAPVVQALPGRGPQQALPGAPGGRMIGGNRVAPVQPQPAPGRAAPGRAVQRQQPFMPDGTPIPEMRPGRATDMQVGTAGLGEAQTEQDMVRMIVQHLREQRVNLPEGLQTVAQVNESLRQMGMPPIRLMISEQRPTAQMIGQAQRQAVTGRRQALPGARAPEPDPDFNF